MPPDAPMVDPATIIAQAQPGQAIYARNQLEPGIWEVFWLLREESAHIAALHQPDIEFRAGAIPQHFHGQEILLIPILVRVGPERQEHIWEVFLNIYQDQGGILHLHDLARQDRLVLHWYGDRGTRERSLVVSNQLKSFAAQAMVEAEPYQPWTMHAFDRARELFYRRYPSIIALWGALTPPGGRP